MGRYVLRRWQDGGALGCGGAATTAWPWTHRLKPAGGGAKLASGDLVPSGMGWEIGEWEDQMSNKINEINEG